MIRLLSMTLSSTKQIMIHDTKVISLNMERSYFVHKHNHPMQSQGERPTHPHVCSFVDGPKSSCMRSLSPSHMLISLWPKKGLEASHSKSVITSAPVICNTNWEGGGGVEESDLNWYDRILVHNLDAIPTHNNVILLMVLIMTMIISTKEVLIKWNQMKDEPKFMDEVQIELHLSTLVWKS